MTAPIAPRSRVARTGSGRSHRRRSSQIASALAVAAGLVSTAAPFALTGHRYVDGLERFLLVAVVTYVGAHAHRRTWFVLGAVAAVPARGTSLVFVLLALAVALTGTRATRRSKVVGACTAGALANAVLWYPAQSPSFLAPVVAVVVLVGLYATGIGQVRRGPRRSLAGGMAFASLLVVVALGTTAWATYSSRDDVEAGTDAARSTLAAVRAGRSEQAQAQLALALTHLDRADRRLNGPLVLPGDIVPGLAQQLRAVQVAVREGLAVSRAADNLVSTDYDSLRYAGRIDLERVRELGPQATQARDALADAEAHLAALDDLWLVGPLRDRVDDFHAEVVDARDDADLADDLVTLVPDLLGGTGTRRYLVAFLQPAELRGGGGFVGSYAELEATDGDVKLVRSGRIDDLIEGGRQHDRAITGQRAYTDRYGRYDPAYYLQDTTFSPDWPSDAAVLAQLYPQAGGRAVDGVIAVDPRGLAALLQLTGPVSVEGLDVPFTAENAVSLLTRDQYLVLGDRAQRGDFLAAATKATFEKLTTASLPAPRKLGDVLGPAARGRHLQVWSPDAAEEALYRRVGADGRVAVAKGDDGLLVVTQNAGNNKIDAYLQRSVTYRATVDARTGEVRATARIVLHNTVPRTDLPAAVVGNTRGAPVGTNVGTLSIYSPQAFTAATIDGKELAVTAGEDLGLSVWDSPMLQVPPGGKVTIELQLRGGVDLRRGYRFSYLPQPVAEPDRFTARISVTHGRFTDGAGDRLASDGEADEQVDLRARVQR